MSVSGMWYHGNQVGVCCWMVTSLPFRVMAVSLKAVYWAKLQANSEVAQNGHCRLWTGTRQASKGMTYGVINCKIEQNVWKRFYAHRLALVFAKNWTIEDISEEGMSVSHLCHNSLCIHADHLAYGFQTVNRARSTCLRQGVCSGHGAWQKCLLHLVLREQVYMYCYTCKQITLPFVHLHLRLHL